MERNWRSFFTQGFPTLVILTGTPQVDLTGMQPEFSGTVVEAEIALRLENAPFNSEQTAAMLETLAYQCPKSPVRIYTNPERPIIVHGKCVDSECEMCWEDQLGFGDFDLFGELFGFAMMTSVFQRPDAEPQKDEVELTALRALEERLRKAKSLFDARKRHDLAGFIVGLLAGNESVEALVEEVTKADAAITLHDGPLLAEE